MHSVLIAWNILHLYDRSRKKTNDKNNYHIFYGIDNSIFSQRAYTHKRFRKSLFHSKHTDKRTHTLTETYIYSSQNVTLKPHTCYLFYLLLVWFSIKTHHARTYMNTQKVEILSEPEWKSSNNHPTLKQLRLKTFRLSLFSSSPIPMITIKKNYNTRCMWRSWGCCVHCFMCKLWQCDLKNVLSMTLIGYYVNSVEVQSHMTFSDVREKVVGVYKTLNEARTLSIFQNAEYVEKKCN